MPAVSEYHGGNFTILQNGRRYATPLLLVLIAIEATDVVFAVDSIPAVFAITTDPFIVYTSNIFAILGLRSMYFLLAGVLDKFHYLKIGLAFVLLFVGLKMVIVDWYKIPIGLSLGVIGGVLGLSVIASMVWPKRVSSAPL
jgi:tellurite resistance protein TerC